MTTKTKSNSYKYIQTYIEKYGRKFSKQIQNMVFLIGQDAVQNIRSFCFLGK